MKLLLDQLRPVVLNVGLAVHNADWNWKNVNSPFMRIYYVTKGYAQIELPDGIYQLKVGHMYLIPSFVCHNYTCDSRFEHYYIHVYEEQQLDGSLFDDWNFPVEICSEESDLELIKRLYAINPFMNLEKSNPETYDNSMTFQHNLLVSKRREFAIKMESRGIIYLLLARFMKQAEAKRKNRDERIEDAIRFIRNHIGENVNLDKLVNRAFLSKDHFIRLFKQNVGITPIQYISRKKIEKAQVMLVTGNMSIQSVSYALGYEDCSYFNRLFKKIVGISPKKYRDLYQ